MHIENKMTKIIIVNDKNEAIGSKERSLLTSADIYRTTGLWITNSKGEILLAQRSLNKKNDSGKWGPAVAGTVEKDETVEENISKETKEELGLSGIDFRKGPVTRNRGEHPHFCQWFFANVAKDIADFQIQEDEVEQIKWFSKQELEQELVSHPEKFLNSIPERLKQFSN